MCDCNHAKIKCMVCHRYLDVMPRPIPLYAKPALNRIEELEIENAELKNQIVKMKNFINTIKGFSLDEGDIDDSL